MRDFRDHPAHGRGVFEGLAAADLVETEADKRRALVARAANGAPDLLDGDRLLGVSHGSGPPVSGVGAGFRLGAGATRLERGHLEITASRNRAGRIFARERIEG